MLILNSKDGLQLLLNFRFLKWFTFLFHVGQGNYFWGCFGSTSNFQLQFLNSHVFLSCRMRRNGGSQPGSFGWVPRLLYKGIGGGGGGSLTWFHYEFRFMFSCELVKMCMLASGSVTRFVLCTELDIHFRSFETIAEIVSGWILMLSCLSSVGILLGNDFCRSLLKNKQIFFWWRISSLTIFGCFCEHLAKTISDNCQLTSYCKKSVFIFGPVG